MKGMEMGIMVNMFSRHVIMTQYKCFEVVLHILYILLFKSNFVFDLPKI